MLTNRLECLISSCDKYSDLWDLQVYHLNKNWPDRNIRTVIVTDCDSQREYDNVEIFSSGNHLEMPQRFKIFLNSVSTEYVFVTLDDYFLINKVDNQRINNILDSMDRYNLDYVRLFSVPKENRILDKNQELYWIDLNRNYGVNLYPGIWRKSFLEETVRDSLNAWQYEVSLTHIARENKRKCAMSRGKDFIFVDVIRKGKLLSKADKYLKSNGMSLNREHISAKEEFKLNLMFWTKKNLPRFIQRIIKKTLSLFGMKFISEGI